HFFDWYCDANFDFRKALSKRELAFADACMRLSPITWSHVINDEFAYSLFSFSHRVRGSRVNSSRAFFATVDGQASVMGDIADLVKARGIRPASVPNFDKTVAIGWDFEVDQFKTYQLLRSLRDIEDPEVKALVALAGDAPKYDINLVSTTFVEGKPVEKKVYVALKGNDHPALEGHPFASEVRHTNLMITTRRGVVPQLDLKQPLDPKNLNEYGRTLAAAYRRYFKMHVDTVNYTSPDDFTLYFPS
ncbi:MAG: hypothetical protein V3T05_11460, partial [Myxococcota bacterium]